MSVSAEKIPRRELPEFNESEESLVGGLIEDGFLRVALDDANQYGPHAMIILLFAVATFTAMALLLATLF
ncbi:MAG: hypothetical protein VYA39_01610 [Candidatus Thermoplasmatota archaeon]|nr:hypothetical protein [Candidatus Thermoplasmatota archaeon]RAH05169.1 MAG: hypothetical protein CMA00_004660 [Euryarchaeota archaeon]|tara:strand:+ start:2122 stop:2331 length:210 start_codon:yes stop_codon:yes gene_type:complete